MTTISQDEAIHDPPAATEEPKQMLPRNIRLCHGLR
jgi:hypothetical protein